MVGESEIAETSNHNDCLLELKFDPAAEFADVTAAQRDLKCAKPPIASLIALSDYYTSSFPTRYDHLLARQVRKNLNPRTIFKSFRFYSPVS